MKVSSFYSFQTDKKLHFLMESKRLSWKMGQLWRQNLFSWQEHVYPNIKSRLPIAYGMHICMQNREASIVRSIYVFIRLKVLLILFGEEKTCNIIITIIFSLTLPVGFYLHFFLISFIDTTKKRFKTVSQWVTCGIQKTFRFKTEIKEELIFYMKKTILIQVKKEFSIKNVHKTQQMNQ